MAAMGKDENLLGLKPRENDSKNPRLAKCFLCGAWALEKNLSPIDIPDQAGWIEKKACEKCLDPILKEEG